MDNAYGEGSTILITGVTGFVGKTVLEKVVYEFPRLKRVYVMVRGVNQSRSAPSNAKDNFGDSMASTAAQARFEDTVLSSQIWNMRVRQKGETNSAMAARILKMVKVVHGTLGTTRCDISDLDWNAMHNEVDAIIHCAASVDFNGHLHGQLATNCVGASELLRLLHGKPNRGVFVHVSTCYVGFPKGALAGEVEGRVAEEACDFPYDPELLLKMVQSASHDEVATMTADLLRGRAMEKCGHNGVGFGGLHGMIVHILFGVTCSGTDVRVCCQPVGRCGWTQKHLYL
jgi:nucleoside-diphosphate-sugar epimerase